MDARIGRGIERPFQFVPRQDLALLDRWLAEGIGFTTFRNIVIVSLFLIGFSPATLSRWYPPKR